MQRTEKVIEIDAPVERVFDLFSDFESFPRWMRNIKEVRRTGHRYTHWTADAPFGADVQWEAETIHFEPDHRIVWRSVGGDVDTEGEVIFVETERGTTLMRVVLGYDPPTGRLGSLIASLFGKNPEQQMEEDLLRFAEMVEGREARRRRRLRARRDEQTERPSRFIGPRERQTSSSLPREGQREARLHDYDKGLSYRERDHRRGRFDEARRDDRAREERYAGEQRRLRETRRAPDDQGFSEMWSEEYGRLVNRQEPRRERRDEEARARHALTPRERERERARGRRPDYDYSKEAFRRGVDKLMEEPPSNRWRRWD
jgi:uncharacterized protein YndB with AHSA1/START domain